MRSFWGCRIPTLKNKCWLFVLIFLTVPETVVALLILLCGCSEIGLLSHILAVNKEPCQQLSVSQRETDFVVLDLVEMSLSFVPHQSVDEVPRVSEYKEWHDLSDGGNSFSKN